MATSGNFTTSNTGGIGTNYPKNATYSWWVNSQSVANNTTDIGYKLVLGGGASSGSSIATYNCGTTTDGESKTFSGGGTYYGNGKELISGTKTITHNADGTKTFSASAYINLYWSSGHSVSGSGSWTLPTIARQAYLSTVQNFNDNGNPTITYTNAAGSAVGTLQACIASSDGNTIYAAYRNINKTGTLSYTFNLTAAERNTLLAACANSNSLAVRFYVKTVIGSTTFYDYKAATMSVVSANPTFSNYTYSDTNSTITAITGNNQVLVANKSTLSVVISSANKAVANKQATMKTYLASLSGKTVSANYSSSGNTLAFTSNAFTAGTQTLSVKATDSRGNATTVNKNVTVVGYSNPVINAVAARLNNYENNTTFTFSGSISPITVGGVRKNDLVGNVQYRYKNQNTSTWGSWTNLTASVAANGTLTINNITLSLDNTASWDMQVKVQDKLATTTKSIVISQGQPQFFVGDDGRVAVGGTPAYSKGSSDTGLLDVKGKIYASTNMYAGQYIYENNQRVYSPNNMQNKLPINPTGRPTSGNLAVSGDATIQHFLASGTMTTGKPPADAHVLHFNWDNTGNWEGQIAIDADSNKGRLWGRSKGGSSTWGSWYEYKRIIPSEDWVFLGKSVNTAAVTNGQVLKVDIPSDYRNCSLKVLCKLELSASSWVDLRAYDASGNILKYTVNLTGSFSGGNQSFGSENMNYFNACYINPAAYKCITMESTSFKNSASGNYRGWNGMMTYGWGTAVVGALQANNTAIASIRLFTGGTCQAQAMLKVWGMKD